MEKLLPLTKKLFVLQNWRTVMNLFPHFLMVMTLLLVNAVSNFPVVNVSAWL